MALRRCLPPPIPPDDTPPDDTPQLLIKDMNCRDFSIVVLGASILNVIGGYMNGVSFAGLFQAGITHVTGATTMSAVTLLIPERNHHPGFYFSILVGHAVGAFLAGLLIGKKRSKWRGKQAVVLTVESFFLWLTFFALHGEVPDVRNTVPTAAFFICVACGLQNGATSNLELFTLRSTAVTGSLNDLFLALGQCAREGWQPHSWKILLWAPCYVSFWIGCLLGTWAYLNAFASATLFPAIAISCFALFTWFLTYSAYYGSRPRAVMTGLLQGQS